MPWNESHLPSMNTTACSASPRRSEIANALLEEGHEEGMALALPSPKARSGLQCAVCSHPAADARNLHPSWPNRFCSI